MDDRQILGDMSRALSDGDRAELEAAECAYRWRTTPESLHVSVATGEMISPSGIFGNEDMALLSGCNPRRRRSFGRATASDRLPPGLSGVALDLDAVRAA